MILDTKLTKINGAYKFNVTFIGKNTKLPSSWTSKTAKHFKQNIIKGIFIVHKEYHQTAQKMRFSIKDFFSKSFLQILTHLLKEFLVENFIFYAVSNFVEEIPLIKERFMKEHYPLHFINTEFQ